MNRRLYATHTKHSLSRALDKYDATVTRIINGIEGRDLEGMRPRDLVKLLNGIARSLKCKRADIWAGKGK